MRSGSPRLVHGLFEVRRKWYIPGFFVQRVLRCAGGLHQQTTGVLDSLPWRVRVEVHDVVRVDQADEQSPRLVLVGQRAALVPQPGHGAPADHVVVGVAAEGVCQHITWPDVVREAVGLHLPGEQVVRLRSLECAVQVPFALVRGVVAGLAQHVAHGGDLGFHRSDIRHVDVLEHPVVGRLQSGEDDRPGTGAHDSRAVVVGERDAVAGQPLSPGQGHPGGPFAEVALLIGENEQDVVFRGRRQPSLGCGRFGRRLRCAGGGCCGRGDRGPRHCEEGPAARPCRVHCHSTCSLMYVVIGTLRVLHADPLGVEENNH